MERILNDYAPNCDQFMQKLKSEMNEIRKNCEKAKLKRFAKLYLKSWDARESETYLKDKVIGDDQDQKFWESHLNELGDE